MEGIRITKEGRLPSLYFKEISESCHFEVQGLLVELGEKCAERMREIITSNLKRIGNTGKLAGSIKSEILNSTGGVEIGIGRISEMPVYHEVLDDGGIDMGGIGKNVPPNNLGYFQGNLGLSQGESNIGSSQGEQWVHTGNKKNFLLKPKTPIEPLNYTRIAYEELVSNIEAQINELIPSILRNSEEANMIHPNAINPWMGKGSKFSSIENKWYKEAYFTNKKTGKKSRVRFYNQSKHEKY